MPPSTLLLARHLLSHPDDSGYRAADHLGLHPRTAQRAKKRLEDRVGLGEPALLDYVDRNKRHFDHRDLHLRHGAPERWLAAPPAPVSLSGEDAAAVEGFDLIPHRHLLYVAEEDLTLLERSLRDDGAVPCGPDEANVTLRVRDPWLLDDPAPLVERGQRLLDYRHSRHVRLREAFRGP